MLTKKQILYSRKESLRIQANKRKYEKEMNAVPKEIPYKHIRPSIEELKILDDAIGYHLRSVNKKRSYNFLKKCDVWADAYEGLIKTLYKFDSNKVKNKRNYLITKIQFFLIDSYRKEYGREGSCKREAFHTISLNVASEGLDDGNEYIDLVLSKEYSSSQLYEDKQDISFIKERFSEIDENFSLSGDDIFAALMLRYEGYSLRKIATAAGVTESRLCQIMNGTVQPLLKKIAEELTEEPSGEILMKTEGYC